MNITVYPQPKQSVEVSDAAQSQTIEIERPCFEVALAIAIFEVAERSIAFNERATLIEMLATNKI